MTDYKVIIQFSASSINSKSEIEDLIVDQLSTYFKEVEVTGIEKFYNDSHKVLQQVKKYIRENGSWGAVDYPPLLEIIDKADQ